MYNVRVNIHKNLIDSIVQKTMDKHTHKQEVSYLMSFKDLYRLLDKQEIDYIKELIAQNPADYGNKEKFKGLETVPDNMVKISGQTVAYDGKTHVIEDQFLPQHVYDAYRQLRSAYRKATGRDLFVGSGYRSPAYQAINFMKWLKYYNYDFLKTLSFVSIPGYSEHSAAEHTAIDFMNQDGVECFDTPPFGRFDDTPEYPWLQKHAADYGFVMTCTKDNDMGFNYEPWHWQYQGI